MRRPEIAGLVAEALQYFHGRQYLLDDWVVMPNHVHLILWPMPNFTLSEILKSRKRQAAVQAMETHLNRIYQTTLMILERPDANRASPDG